MPIIQVLIFRGTGGVRNKNHPYYNEAPLVRAGHVAVAGIIEGKIIGFHPNPEIAESLGGSEALLQKLGQFEAQPGRLQVDNVYFERAAKLAAETNGRTTVYTYDVEISDETLSAIRTWYNEKREVSYSFPNQQGQFKEGESNCAMFWVEWFKIPFPKRTGSIRMLTDHMKAEDYEIWQAKNEF